MRRLRTVAMAVAMLLFLTMPVGAGNNPSVMLGDRELVSDAAPFLEGGRVLVPVRALAEALGFQVQFLEATNEVVLTKGDSVITLKADSNQAMVNGQATTLDVPLTVNQGRTFVPIRFVAENLGAAVVWDGEQERVLVTPADGAAASARALLERVTAVSAQTPDQKATGSMITTVHLQLEGMNVTVEVPVSFNMHVYQGDILMNLNMSVPGPAGMTNMTLSIAGRDGTLYMTDPASGEWTVTGSMAPGEVPDLSSLGISGLDMMQLQGELLADAKVAFGASKLINNVKTTRLDIEVDGAPISELISGLAGSFGMPEEDSIGIDVTKLKYSMFVDPVTAFTHQTDIEMAIKANIEAAGQASEMLMEMKGSITAKPTAEPIAWPDLPESAANE